MRKFCWTLRCLISIALVATLSGMASAQETPETTQTPMTPLTVDAAVTYALAHNPSITLGNENVQIAQDQVTSARANGLPTAGVTVSATYVPNPLVISFNGQSFPAGSAFSSSAQATVSQPVWPATQWQAPIKAAQGAVGVNSENLRRTKQQVVFQTRQAFFQLLTSVELIDVADYSVQVAQAQLHLAEATYAAGTAPFFDIEQARATLADAEVNQTRAQNSVDISRASLATQLGLPASTPITITPPAELPTAPAALDPLVETALISRPELMQLNYRREQLRASIALARLQTQPIVRLSANYSKTITGGSLFGQDGVSFAAVLNFTIFNGGRSKADVSAAKKQLQQVTTLAGQLELGVRLDVRSAWLNLQNALKQLPATKTQQEAADSALRIAQLRYTNGEGILLEVDQAQLRSTQARTSLAQARFQALVAAAQLEFALGITPPPPAGLVRTPVTATLPATAEELSRPAVVPNPTVPVTP